MTARPQIARREDKAFTAALLPLLLAAWLCGGCSAMNGVNVGASVPIGGVVGVGVSTRVGTGQGREQPSRETSKTPAPGLKLYVFDCGRLQLEDVSMFGLSNTDTEVRELFVPCYLIEHPTAGRLLWDAGLSPDIVGTGPQTLEPGTTQEYRESLLDQMAALRLAPSDIKYVAFSHMHFDHVGSANAFTDSILLIQQAEYDAAFRHPEDNPIFQPALYEQLAGNTKVLLNGDHDVFGDGSARIISAPGHTPGHQVLWLDLQGFGPLVLAGDLYHFEASRKLRAVPVFNTDEAETLKSMQKVEKLVSRTKATLWIEHNMALALRLNLAPSYYD